MSVVSPRNRVVYFRISEQEFNRLSGLCGSAEGSRSVSELARTAVQKMLVNDGQEGWQEETNDLRATIDQFRERINEIDGKLEQVLTLLVSPSRMGCS